MTTQPSRKLLISGLSENTSNESISGYLSGEQFGNPSVSIDRINTGEAIVEVTGLQNVEQLLSNIPGSFHGANVRLLPDEVKPHLQGQPVFPPAVSEFGPPTQYGGSVPQHSQHSSQMPPYNVHSRSLMHDQSSPLQYPGSSVQPTKLHQIQQVQGNQPSQIYDQSSQGYYGGQESQKYQTEYNWEHVNRGPGLSNPPLLHQRAQCQGVSYQGVSSSQTTPHGHPPLPRQLHFPSQWGQQKAPTQSGYQGNCPQSGYLGTLPQAGFQGTPPQSGYQGTPSQAGYHEAPLQSGYQEISLSGHKEIPSMSGHGAQLQSGHQEAPPQSEHQEIPHQSRPQESLRLSGREDIPPNSGSHMLPSHFESQNVPPSGPRKFPPHSGPQNIPPPPPCLGPQIENLPPHSGSHEFPPQSEGQELSSHSQQKRNPQEFPDQPETRNIPLLPQSQECPPYSEPQQIPPQSGLQQFPPQSGPVKFESQNFDNQAETSKGTLQSESPAFLLSSNSQIFSSESISQEFPLESEQQGNPMSARTLPQSAPLEPPPHMRPRVHNAPPQPGSQEHPSQSKPQEYSPKFQPQEYPPQSRLQQYPPQVGPQEYPLQSRPQGYLPQSRPQECPPQSPPQEYPPQSQPQEYPPQSQPQKYPPQSRPQEYPHQSRPQEYPPHSLSQGYLPQPGPQGYPTEPGKQIYPPHPRHEYQPQPRSQRHAPQPELQEYPPQPELQEYPPQPQPQKQPPQPQPQTHSPQTGIQVSPQSRPVVSTTWSGSQDIPSRSPINPAYPEKSQTFSHPPPWSQDTGFPPSQMESFQGQHGWHGSTHSTEPQRSHSQHGVHPPSEMHGSSAPFTPQHSYPQLSLQGDFHQQSQPAQESFQTSSGDPKISKESMMSLTPSPYVVSPGHSPQCLRSEQGSMSHDSTGTGSDYLQKTLETCSVGIEHSPKHPAQVDTYHDSSHKEAVKIDSQQVAHDVVESVDSTSQPTSLLDLQLLMEELSESFIVKVIDLEIDEIDEDVIDNLFSNEDEGGGDIEGIEIDPEKSIVYITFKDSAVAKRVSERKQWSVMGQNASVSLHHKEFSEIMKLFHLARRHPSHAIIIENVPKDTDGERLVLRLEKVFRDKKYKLVLEGSDTNAILAHEGTKVLLILACGNDTVRQTIIDELNKGNITFKKEYPAIKAVCFPAISEISVANIADDKCKEAQLRDYFANRKKSSGGPVEKVKIIGRGRAMIKFKGSASAESTMAALADHKKYLGEDVRIDAHHPLFDEWLESSKSVTHTGKSVSKQNPFTYPIKSPMIWTYVQNRLEVLNTLKGRLKEICANAELDQKFQQLNIKPKHGSEFIENWTNVCTEAISENLSVYSEGKVEISEGTSGPAYQLIFTLTKEHSSVEISPADKAVSIVGPTKEVDRIQELIQKVVTENMDCVKKETLPLMVLVYIQDCILKALQAKFKHVLMKVILEEDCLEVTGKASKCEEFLAEVRRVNPSSVKVPISEDAVHLLACPIGKEYILSKMPKKVKMAYYFTTADGTIQGSGMAALNNLYLVADSDHMATVTQVAKEIASSLVSTDISVPSEFKIAERSRAWDDLKKNIELKYVALLVPDSASRVISVVSDKHQIDNLKEKISVFIEQECYVKETVTLEAGQWKFLQKYCREWILLEKEVKDTTTRCDIPTGTDRGPTVVLEGETTPTKELARRIRALKSNICTGRREISKPGLVEHFYSEEGKRQLIAVGTLHDAVVEVSTAEDREYEEEKIAMEDNHPILICGMVSEGAMVEIRKGDLTEFPVDVMVNAANEQLNHGGGIAGIISRKGGDIIQQESDQYVIRRGQVDIGKAVILKGTGNLPCKSIVHAVGPRWRGGKHHEYELLSKAVYSSLQQAESKHFQSICFPAISSGIFGVPIDVCAKAMFDGITSFFEDSDHQMKVIIMLFEEKHVADFISVAKQSLQNPSQPMRQSKTESMSLRSKSEGAKVAPRRTSSSASIRNASSAIDIRHGSLLDFPADIYVNTTASSLVLTNGAVSQMLLKAGGQELQNECNKYVQQNGDVKEWDFATTGPGKLKCKNVVHTVGSNYNGGSGRKDMEEMISNVMKECDRLKASSVAFPSIGTGALGFPPDVVAEIMVNVVSSHLSKNRKTTIKKILFVIYDDKVFKCFEAQCATRPSPVKSDPPHRQNRPPTKVLHSMPKSNIQLKRKSAMAATITEVRQGSLTSVDADVYVDTTAPNLNLSDRPVSKSLLQVAGQKLQDECTRYVQQHGNVPAWSFATTGPGNLKCKHIFHTVASDYDGPGGSAEKGLGNMMMDVMQNCGKVQASSVAIPSIGAGNLGFPPDVVARIMFQTTTAYLEQNINTSLKKIILVIFDSTTYNAFQAAQPRFSSSSSMTSIPTNVSHHTASGGRNVSSCIEVKQGSLTDFTADVYADTTSPDLQLASRPVSKSLLQVAGQKLQDECTRYVQQHGNVPAWSFATTGPGNLKCKHVFHTVASDYDGPGGSAEKGMKQMIEKVMQECDRLKATSLAIPSIGAGNFHFPPQNLARILIDAVSVYLHNNRNSSVKRVLFVIFDTNIFKVFQTAHSQPGGNHSFQGKGSGQATADGDGNGSVFQCKNMKIVLVQGDITKEAVDGIVNTASETLELNQFGVQGALLNKGGQELQTQCRDIYRREGPLKPNAVKVTGPGRRGGLKCQKILHVLAPEQAKNLKGTVKSVLKKANNLQLRSIALPAIGTGQHGFTPSKAAQYICEGIVAFSKHSNSMVTEVRIVVFEQRLFTEFGRHFQETGQRSGALKSLAGGFWSVVSYLGRKLWQGEESSDSSDFESGYGDEDDAIESRGPIPSRSLQQYYETAYLVISVYADSKETVENVITEIEVVIDKDFVRDEISDNMVGELSTDSVDELHELAFATHVELDVDHRMKRIIMKGEKSKVSDIKLKVKELFHELDMLKTQESFAMEQAETERRELEKRMELAAEAFHWQFESQAGVFEDFGPEISFVIEEAFVKKEFSYKFDTEDSTSFEIDFVQNVITDQSGNVSRIRRHDFKEESLQLHKQLAEGGNIVYPDHWAKMPMDGKGKELVWHPVSLSPTDQEYMDVLQEFEKTMTTQFNVSGKTTYTKMLAIKRIQNPTLYSTYITRKKIMDKANPKGHQNERRLFHGCAPDSVENINKTGFNRSFCGKNATAIGQGSYFAVNASYSASLTYSPPDTNGKRHMFLARVLTGEYTQGHSSMKDPPAKDNHSKYDSVVNNIASPGMYVVFYDTQAYPDHLIEFQ